MSLDLAIDPATGDLFEDLRTVDGNDGLAQEVQTELRWWLAQWFLDLSRGMPYLEQLLRKGVSERTARAVLKRQIERVSDVRRVVSIRVSIDRATRACTVDELVIVGPDGEVDVTAQELG